MAYLDKGCTVLIGTDADFIDLSKDLSIDIEKLGFLPYDEKVSECIKLLKPYYLRFPDSETVGCIDDIRDQMIAKL